MPKKTEPDWANLIANRLVAQNSGEDDPAAWAQRIASALRAARMTYSPSVDFVASDGDQRALRENVRRIRELTIRRDTSKPIMESVLPMAQSIRELLEEDGQEPLEVKCRGVGPLPGCGAVGEADGSICPDCGGHMLSEANAARSNGAIP